VSAEHELTTAEVAAMLAVSDAYVRRLCRDGVIRARRDAAGHWRIRIGAVHDYLAARTEPRR